MSDIVERLQGLAAPEAEMLANGVRVNLFIKAACEAADTITALQSERTNLIDTKRQQLAAKDEEIADLRSRLLAAEKALEPFADFAEFMEVETEGFSDTDRLELVPEESDVRIGDILIGQFRLARTTLNQIRGTETK